MGNQPSPLRRAIRANDLEAVKHVLQKGGDDMSRLINQDHSPDCIMESCTRVQGNAFYYAVSRNRTEIVELLLKNGADIYTTGQYEETCLHCAARHANLTIVKLLVENGLRGHVKITDDQGMLPIHSAAASIYNTSNVVRYLLQEAGAPEDVNARNFAGRTPLHEAAFMGNVEVVQCLLSCGADVNVQSKAGNTPLHACKRNPAVWKLLVDAGADENVKNQASKIPAEMMT